MASLVSSPLASSSSPELSSRVVLRFVSLFIVAVPHPSSSSVCLPQSTIAYHQPAVSLLPRSRLTRGPRVSRRASWWLHRWLLASLEGSQESVPPRGSRNSLGNRFTSSSAPHLRHLSPRAPLRCFSLASFHLEPPYAPSGSYLRVSLIFSYYPLVDMWARLTHTRAPPLPVHTRQRDGPPRGAPSVFLRGPLLRSSSGALFFSVLPPLRAVFSPLRASLGTPICEHIITSATERPAEGGGPTGPEEFVEGG